VETRAADLPAVRTDATGLALMEELPTGAVPLRFDSGSLSLQVVQPRELYDVAVAYRDSGVEHVGHRRDVRVLGGSNRLRGVDIAGRLTVSANNFSAAFCDVGAANITGNGVSLIRNRFVAGQATIPSSAAVLVDNTGIP
jgi:hypothetical protein